MKIYIPNSSNTKIGGGHSFLENFRSCVGNREVELLEECDIVLICGATMVKREEFDQYKRLGKKIVLRVDGVPEDWRNRGTGWSRLKEYAQRSDLVIYQSEFSKNTTGRLIGVAGSVVYNGVDTTIFSPNGTKFMPFGNPSILYCNYRKGEHNKRVEEAIERFRMMKLDFPMAKITFVGDYPKEQFLWNERSWDFGMLDLKQDVDWQYLGIIPDRSLLASIMRSNMYIAFPSFADPCPNTLIEAMCCGCQVLWQNEYGGQAEIIEKFLDFDWSKERMTNEYIYLMKNL